MRSFTVLVCAEPEASAAGAAALAWEFLGGSPARARGALPAAPSGREVLPDPSTVDGYNALFAVYRRTYPALSELFPDLAAAANAIAGR